MGLFSSKTKYYVASQIYNLAGDLNDRTDYMSTVSVQAALRGQNIIKHIQQGILEGPGFNLRSFQRWANTSYELGLPTADIMYDEITDLSSIAGQIPLPSGSPTGTKNIVMTAVITKPDTEIWTEKYLLENHPDLVTQDWAVEQDDIIGEITITFKNGREIKFIPSQWNQSKDYLAVRYTVSSPGVNGAQTLIRTSPRFKLWSSLGLKDYSLVGTPTNRPTQNFVLNRKEIFRVEFKDGSPSTETVDETTENVAFVPLQYHYRWDENKGILKGTNRTHIMSHRKNIYEEGDKVTNMVRDVVEYSDRIEISTTYTDVLEKKYWFNYYNQPISGVSLSEPKLWLYEMGSTNAVLNNLRRSVATRREFFPVLPLRIDNRFIDEDPYKDSIYDDVKKAYTKAYGSKITKMLDELNDNDDLDDLDFAFLVFGVTINEKDNSGKLYMYEFLKNLMQSQLTSKAEFEGYQNMLAAQAKQQVEFNRWDSAVINNLKGQIDRLDPVYPTYPPPRISNFILDSNMPHMDNYKITISWSYISEELHIGKGKTNAKKGDLWFESAAPILGSANVDNLREGSLIGRAFRSTLSADSNKRIYLYHQTDKLTYRRLEIVGLTHSNYVYKNKSVVTTAYDAIKDTDEESTFFFPMHYPTLKELPLKNQNQLGYCSRLLLLNCYIKKKIKWYQRGIFKIVFAIAMIAISVITMNPTVLGAMPGLLGTNLAVGTMLGLAGTAAVIAGSVANMVAAMILTTVIQKASVELLGEKWGQLIGAVASFVALQFGANFAMNGNFNLDWSKLFRVDNLLNVTKAVSTGYAGFVQADIQKMMEDYENASSEYKEQMKMIDEKMAELYGSSTWIDPMMFVDMASASEPNFRESHDSFIQRTLLTGSEICEMSMAMISEFTNVSLELPAPIA